VIVPYLFGWTIPQEQAFVFNVLVQNGTLLAVIVYFWKDLMQIAGGFLRSLFAGRPGDPSARLGWLIILATIPAGLFGLAVKSLIEAAFASVAATAVFLFITAALLLIAERVGTRQRSLEQLGWKDALTMGVFQALAVFPGISRSGSTMAGGMIRNLDRAAAARFSFLMSIPIMLAAGGLETVDLINMPIAAGFLPVLAAGIMVSAVVGYFSIRWLLAYLMRHSLKVFAIYCAVAGTLILLLSALRG
jgi:undecaprenyl-diphosphatase